MIPIIILLVTNHIKYSISAVLDLSKVFHNLLTSSVYHKICHCYQYLYLKPYTTKNWEHRAIPNNILFSHAICVKHCDKFCATFCHSLTATALVYFLKAARFIYQQTLLSVSWFIPSSSLVHWICQDPSWHQVKNVKFVRSLLDLAQNYLSIKLLTQSSVSR